MSNDIEFIGDIENFLSDQLLSLNLCDIRRWTSELLNRSIVNMKSSTNEKTLFFSRYVDVRVFVSNLKCDFVHLTRVSTRCNHSIDVLIDSSLSIDRLDN
jgi:hypothetical protein